MITKPLPFLHIHKFLKLLNGMTLLFFSLFSISIGGKCFQPDKKITILPQPPKLNQSKMKPLVHYEKIGEGALKTSSGLSDFPLPDLKEELYFLGKNTRPDATMYDLLIHIGLSKSGQSIKVTSGQKIYLTYSQGFNPFLALSSKPTPLWVMPYLSEKGEMLVEFGLCLLTAQHEKLIEDRKVASIEDLRQVRTSLKKESSFEEAISHLENGKWLESDRLFEMYGGEHYQQLKNHKRVEFVYKDTSAVIHLIEGDCLTWKNGVWVKSEAGEESQKTPLAQLKSITPHKMEWEVWSCDGLDSTTVCHKKQTCPQLTLRVEEAFSRMRQRTASKVSCCIGNKPMILKTGDWVLHTSSGWHVLKSLSEIEKVLTFQSKGELFIFDGIQKSEGKSIFSGTLFNLMRTEEKKVKILMTTQTKSKYSSHKKKMISSRIHSISSEERSHDNSSDNKKNKTGE